MALKAIAKETKNEKVTRLEEEALAQIEVDKSSLIKETIRTKYTVDDEFKILNLGIADSTDPTYLEYREFVKAVKEDNL